MMISTRGRYALRILVYLAENSQQGYIPMKTVAEEEGISLKYIEKIIPVLTKSGYVGGVTGKGGGYKLLCEPSLLRLGDILRLTEGDLAPVKCLEKSAAPCARKVSCPTFPVWSGFYKIANDYFDGITIADIMKKQTA